MRKGFYLCFLITILGLVLGKFVLDAFSEISARNLQRDFEKKYAEIVDGMDEFAVGELFKVEGVDVSLPGEPQTLGDLPVFPAWSSEFKNEKVRWKKWQLPGEADCWIAVGFAILGEGGIVSVPEVVAKTKHGF
jgi:hypothetical protein